MRHARRLLYMSAAGAPADNERRDGLTGGELSKSATDRDRQSASIVERSV